MGLGKSKDAASTKKPTKGINNGSSSGAAEITAHDRAVLQLKLQRDRLGNTTRKLDVLAQKEHDKAKAFMAEGKKEKALYCLKRKRAQEVKVASIRQMLDNIHEMLSSLDFAKIEADVVASMKEGTNALNVLHRHMQAENVEQVMDEAFEAIQISREVSELLGEPLSTFDEEAILAELESWEKPREQKEHDVDVENLKVPRGAVGSGIDKLVVPISHVGVEEEEPQERNAVAA